MITNPKRNVTVEMSVEALKKRVKKLHKIYGNIDMTYALNKEDDFLNTYTYRVKEGGVSLGAMAVITLKKESDTHTTIEVEMQRINGSYDSDVEVSYANDEMKAIFTALSQLAQISDEQLETYEVKPEQQISTGLGKGGTCLLWVIGIAIAFWVVWNII